MPVFQRLAIRALAPADASRCTGPAPSSATSPWTRWVPSWPLLVGLAAFALAVAHPLSLLHDPDTYLHIAAGRWMLLHGALPDHDPFSYSMAGAHWSAPEWLAELVLAGVYGIAGWSGLVLLTAAAFATSAAILMRCLLRDGEPLSAMIVVLLACTLTLSHLLARPHMLALPVLVLWCGGLFRARDGGRAPSLLLLPLLTLWANLHASFLFGLLLAGFLAGEAVLFPHPGKCRSEELTGWGRFVLLALLASLLTPNGMQALTQPFRLLAMPALQTFEEWASPNFQQLQPIEIVLLGLVTLSLTTRARLPLPRLLLLLGLCHMTLQHIRNAELLGFVGPLAVSATLGAEIAAKLRAMPRSGLTRGAEWLTRPAGSPAGILILLLAGLIALPLILSPIRRTDGPATPSAALAAARRLRLSGRVFNSEGFGGYLIFRGVPTFIDGRLEMYGNRFFERYLTAEHHADALARLLDRYHADWALLAPHGEAAALITRLPGWRRVWAGRNAVVAARSSAFPRGHFATLSGPEKTQTASADTRP